MVGSGSVGLRHARNLRALGAEVWLCSARGGDADPEGLAHRVFSRLEEALDAAPAAVVVANRTEEHLAVAIAAARAGTRGLLIEKPLSHDITGIDTFLDLTEQEQLVVECGFMLRWHPNLRWIKEALEADAIGEVHYARALVGQHLAEWRPGRDHRTGYGARRPGGGVILDLIHELDLVRWLVGDVEFVHAMTAHVPSLGIDTEAVAQIGLRCSNGALAQVHLDYVRPVYARQLEIAGRDAVLLWDFTTGVVLRSSPGDTGRVAHVVPGGFQRNDLFMDEMRHFLARLADRAAPAVCPISDGLAGLALAIASHESAASGCAIKPSEVLGRIHASGREA